MTIVITVLKYFVVSLLLFGVILTPWNIQRDIKGREPRTVLDATITNILGMFAGIYLAWFLLTHF